MTAFTKCKKTQTIIRKTLISKRYSPIKYSLMLNQFLTNLNIALQTQIAGQETNRKSSSRKKFLSSIFSRKKIYRSVNYCGILAKKRNRSISITVKKAY